jgi:hypothetical protein
VRPPQAHEINEVDLAQDMMGRNALQGDDQANVHNQRYVEPGVNREPDDLIETFEKADKDVRARRDLGKGRRHSPKHPYNQPEE